MNDLPGARPDCDVCPDPCLVTCDNGRVIAPLGAQCQQSRITQH